MEKLLKSDDWKGLIKTDEDTLLRKTGAIFENAKQTTIKWETNTDKENFIYRDKEDRRHYHISVANPPHPQIPTYTAGQHEIAHMAFDTFTGKSCKEFFARWVDKFPKSYKYKPLAKEMFEMLANVIEDERIESLLGDIYHGTWKRFVQYKSDVGKGYVQPKDIDPCNAILCVRFGRIDLCPKEWRKEAIKALRDVEMTGMNGLLTCGERYVDKIVYPWLLKNGHTIPIRYVMDGSCMKKTKDFNGKCDHRMLGNDAEDGKDTPKKAKSLDDCKKEGKNDVKKCVGDMEKHARTLKEKPENTMPEDAGVITYLNRYDGRIKIDINRAIARGINKVFKDIQSKTRTKLYEYGETMDIPSVIRRKCKGYGNIFRAQKIKNDLTLVVSIDVSGSMHGEPVDSARKMCATIFKAIEGLKGIKFHCFVWNGGDGHLAITEVNKLEECRSINCEGPGATPTPEAMAFSVARLKQLGGKNRVLIFITDGSPDGGGEGTKTVRKWVREARKDGTVVIGMYPSAGDEGDDYGMKDMFGAGHFMLFQDMDKASGKIINVFKQLVMKQVKGRG